MDDMSAIYQQHAQTVYKFLLGKSDVLSEQGKASEWRCVR